MVAYTKGNLKIEVIVCGWGNCLLDEDKEAFEGFTFPLNAKVREFEDGHMVVSLDRKTGEQFLRRTFTYRAGWTECHSSFRPKLLNN